MAEPRLHPSFPALLQQFFVEYLAEQRAVSRHTVASYRDTFQLFLLFAKKATGKMPTNLALQAAARQVAQAEVVVEPAVEAGEVAVDLVPGALPVAWQRRQRRCWRQCCAWTTCCGCG